MSLAGKTIILDFDSTMFPLYTAIGTLDGYEHVSYETMRAWDDLYSMCGGSGVAGNVFREAGLYDIMAEHDPFEHVVETVKKWHAEGARLVVMSDRCPSTRSSVIRWLADHGIPIADEDVYCERLANKLPLCKTLGAHAVVDDKPLTMIAAHRAGMLATGLDLPYNTEVAIEHGIRLATNWRGIDRIMRRGMNALAV